MIALMAIFLVLQTSAPPNSCVACHEGLIKNNFLKNRFSVWKQSRHHAAGIGCDGCHGGDSNSSDPVKAHAAVLPSTDTRSSTYYTNLPQTCGRCHQVEYAAFRRSSHFAKLGFNEPGPSCNSCHWNMGSAVPARGQYQEVCRSCHNSSGLARNFPTQPLLAENTMLRLQVIELRLSKLQPRTEQEAQRIDQLRMDLDIAQRLWHTFNLPGLKSFTDRIAGEFESLRLVKTEEVKSAKRK